jgi:hypothetical protein
VGPGFSLLQQAVIAILVLTVGVSVRNGYGTEAGNVGNVEEIASGHCGYLIEDKFY